MTLHLGDCLNSMKQLPDNSADSIVTDPPYGLSFMGKKWDYEVPSIEIWKECLRVLKPGGHLLSFGGTRTYHRLVVNIEDAGFEIRDCIQWLYGSGFPKSTDVSKRIDKEAGAEREVIGQKDVGPDMRGGNFKTSENRMVVNITSASTDSAKQWQGWGTALKPANEPICVARKPLEKGLTVAENVLKYGTGAINIDGCRIAASAEDIKKTNRLNHKGNFDWKHGDQTAFKLGQGADISQGRWPANIILDEEAAMALDEQSGVLKSGAIKPHHKNQGLETIGTFKIRDRTGEYDIESSSGGASRFFYVAKASKAERNKGLEGMPTKHVGTYAQDEWSRNNMGNTPDNERKPVQNFHPTVKPIKLMEYLIKLVTPPNGTTLDPFMGSGTTGVAAKQLGFKFIGCEMSEDYFNIAKQRIESV